MIRKSCKLLFKSTNKNLPTHIFSDHSLWLLVPDLVVPDAGLDTDIICLNTLSSCTDILFWMKASLKQSSMTCHADKIFITGCTRSRHADNFNFINTATSSFQGCKQVHECWQQRMTNRNCRSVIYEDSLTAKIQVTCVTLTFVHWPELWKWYTDIVPSWVVYICATYEYNPWNRQWVTEQTQHAGQTDSWTEWHPPPPPPPPHPHPPPPPPPTNIIMSKLLHVIKCSFEHKSPSWWSSIGLGARTSADPVIPSSGHVNA